jgi:hypothetical protein
MSQEELAKRLSVLVPVSADARAVSEVHADLVAYLADLGVDFEILYLVSPRADAARSEIRRLYERDPGRVRVIEFTQAVSEAAMLTAGFERARSDVLCTVPARFETDFSALAPLLEALREGADVAVAGRTRGRTGSSARLQSQAFNRLVSLAAGVQFRDVASGTRAFRRHVVEEIPLYGDFHRYLPLLADRLGFRVVEIAAAAHPRLRAPAVHPPSIYLWRAIDVLTVIFVARFTRYPLRLFGGVGSLFAAAGALMLLVLAVQRMLGTPLADRPILVLAVLLVGLGVQAFSIGLLGELVLFLHARNLRDYRIGAIYEGTPPSLSETTDGDGQRQA